MQGRPFPRGSGRTQRVRPPRSGPLSKLASTSMLPGSTRGSTKAAGRPGTGTAQWAVAAGSTRTHRRAPPVRIAQSARPPRSSIRCGREIMRGCEVDRSMCHDLASDDLRSRLQVIVSAFAPAERSAPSKPGRSDRPARSRNLGGGPHDDGSPIPGDRTVLRAEETLREWGCPCAGST
jgi:hypothetical protein